MDDFVRWRYLADELREVAQVWSGKAQEAYELSDTLRAFAETKAINVEHEATLTRARSAIRSAAMEAK